MPIIVPHISLAGFVLSTDTLVFIHNPQVLWKEIPALKLCSQSPVEMQARMQKCWGFGLVWGTWFLPCFFFFFWAKCAFCTNSAHICLHSPVVTEKKSNCCCQVVCLRSPDKWQRRRREPSWLLSKRCGHSDTHSTPSTFYDYAIFNNLFLLFVWFFF